MEAMNMNLRKLLKTYGGDQGIAIKAVSSVSLHPSMSSSSFCSWLFLPFLHQVLSYTKQLMAGLNHLHKHNIVHADLKPDNIVVNAQMNVLKVRLLPPPPAPPPLSFFPSLILPLTDLPTYLPCVVLFSPDLWFWECYETARPDWSGWCSLSTKSILSSTRSYLRL